MLTVVDRLGGAHRGTAAEFPVPAGDAGMRRSPVLVGKPEIEIAQRAADRDVADAEGRGGELVGFPLERREHGLLAWW